MTLRISTPESAYEKGSQPLPDNGQTETGGAFRLNSLDRGQAGSGATIPEWKHPLRPCSGVSSGQAMPWLASSPLY